MSSCSVWLIYQQRPRHIVHRFNYKTDSVTIRVPKSPVYKFYKRTGLKLDVFVTLLNTRIRTDNTMLKKEDKKESEKFSPETEN